MGLSNLLNRQSTRDPQSLTPEEQAEYDRCVVQVRRGFLVAGQALKVIRDRQLYRAKFETFEVFCEQLFAMTSRRAYQLIDAAEAADALKGATIQPTHEAQLRPIAQLQPAEQQRAWAKACDVAGGSPTADQVQDVLPMKTRRRGKKKAGKPVRIKVAGAVIVITPNKAFVSVEQALTDALAKLARPEAA